MRYMRLFALLLLLALLTGCGGGGGSSNSGSRKITIVFHWPTSGRHIGKAPIKSVNSALVEVYDGTQRIGYVQFTAPMAGGTLTSTQTLTVPYKDLTFYANGFSTATSPDPNSADTTYYATDVRTGLLAQVTGGVFTPLGPSNSAGVNPVAHAVTVVNIPALGASPTVAFTWNNTITSLTPIITPIDKTTFALSAGVQTLSSTIQAQDNTGANILFDPTELTFTIDPTDTLGALRASIAPSTDQLTPNATGTVRVIVQDTAVNAGQNQTPIHATVTYTITNPAPITLAVSASQLLPQLAAAIPSGTPLYAQSVKLTLTEQGLGAGDNPQPVVTATAPVTFQLGPPRTVTVGVLSTSFTFTGRPFKLTVEAYSNTGGTGVLIAQSPPAPQQLFTALTDGRLTAAGATYTYNPAVFLAADYQITGFSIAPVTNTAPPYNIYYLNAGQTVPGLPTSIMVQATLLGAGSVSTSHTVDPRTLTWISSGAAASVADGVVTSAAVGTATPVTITAKDRFATPIITTPGGQGASIVVNPVTGSPVLNVN